MLRRVSFQSSTPLRGAYEHFLTMPLMDGPAQKMLALLPGLETMCEGLPVWGMTSHARLWLFPTDDMKARWAVLIDPVFGSTDYLVGYHVPESHGSGLNDLNQAIASTPEEALALIAVAMQRSGGWAMSPTPPSAA
jgi:hypothetical protein